MNDRELLELAAKAAGFIEFTWNVEPRARNPNGVASHWNPLVDDGDALRLAVKLRLRIEHDAAYQAHQERNTKVRVRAEHQALIVGYGRDGAWEKEFHDSDPAAATRRAIVRSAAEIGKAMP